MVRTATGALVGSCAGLLPEEEFAARLAIDNSAGLTRAAPLRFHCNPPSDTRRFRLFASFHAGQGGTCWAGRGSFSKQMIDVMHWQQAGLREGPVRRSRGKREKRFGALVLL